MEVCYIVLVCRFLPEFLSRPLRHSLPGEGIYEVHSFFCRCGSGHPRRGVPTFFTVGNGLRAVPQNARKRPPYSGESARSPDLSLRGAKRRGNLLERRWDRYPVTGDCRVGLRPPRNDVLILTQFFFCLCGNGHPGRGVPTGSTDRVPTSAVTITEEVEGLGKPLPPGEGLDFLRRQQ